jgi:GTP-binding protein Era
MVGEKISIVSPREQTTRDTLRGVLVEGNSQIVFVDTPGIFIPKKRLLLERTVVRNAWKGVEESDVVCLLLDCRQGVDRRLTTLIQDISRRQEKIIFVINKVDLLRKEKLLKIAEELGSLYPKFMRIFMVSALSGENVDKLKKYLLELSPVAPWMFGEDDITDAPMKFIASEITREKIFLNLEQELPYSIDVVTDGWEDFENGDLKIRQTIRVIKENQKTIVIGRAGSMLKSISVCARLEMEKFFSRRVHLFLFVKVKNDWIREKFGSSQY